MLALISSSNICFARQASIWRGTEWKLARCGRRTSLAFPSASPPRKRLPREKWMGSGPTCGAARLRFTWGAGSVIVDTRIGDGPPGATELLFHRGSHYRIEHRNRIGAY